ncbi:hypothetical protein BKA56DRAFT_623227 [Ilyonectria sp. MPI-CAGE-AT-0026]|nr:hypothetical protein BKA56DRAFT_623227 [Ilyonectria sp. MPI-CAGE-AT-0026]
MATSQFDPAIRLLERYRENCQGQGAARQLDHFNAVRLYKQLCHARDIIGVHRLRLLPSCLINSYRARLREQMKELKRALIALSEQIDSMKGKKNNQSLSSNIAEEIIHVIEHLIGSMGLFHCFIESQFKKKQERFGQVDEVNTVLIGIEGKIVRIIEEKERRERERELERQGGEGG